MTDTANLEDGFYWVRFVNSDWIVVEIYDGGWYINGDATEFSYPDFHEIDPCPIKRDDVK